MLIYQEKDGSSNKDKQPVGGIISSSTPATFIMKTIKNPITFYGEWGEVVNQTGHTKDLWDYYWTSYSRGVDRSTNYTYNWHNNYLDSYELQRLKSIYDPCPHGFRAPTNGTWNQLTKSDWINGSYSGGSKWILDGKLTWFAPIGWRKRGSVMFEYTGSFAMYFSSTSASSKNGYNLTIDNDYWVYPSRTDLYRCYGFSVRCIDFTCELGLIKWDGVASIEN